MASIGGVAAKTGVRLVGGDLLGAPPRPDIRTLPIAFIAADPPAPNGLAARRLQGLGALIAFAVMSGAVNFHLWTPLGIDPNNDGGGLFFMACVVLATSLLLIYIRRREIAAIAGGVAAALTGPAPSLTTSKGQTQ